MRRGFGSVAATVVLAVGLVSLSGPVAPAWADGMEPQPAPPKAAVHRHPRIVHHVRHHGRHHPAIGYRIIHRNYDLASPVYAMPDWPNCSYVLETQLVRTVWDSYTGAYDCNP